VSSDTQQLIPSQFGLCGITNDDQKWLLYPNLQFSSFVASTIPFMKTVFRVPTTLITMSAVLLLASCSKDNDPVPTDLIVGNWQISSVNFTMTVGSQSLVDYLIAQGLSAEEAQVLADEFQTGFAEIDGTIEIKKGGTYSATTDGSTETGTWELSSDGKTLTMDKGTAYEIDFTITTLTSSNLTMTSEVSESDSGLTVIIRIDISLTR
jgi:hypothetical protein